MRHFGHRFTIRLFFFLNPQSKYSFKIQAEMRTTHPKYELTPRKMMIGDGKTSLFSYSITVFLSKAISPPDKVCCISVNVS